MEFLFSLMEGLFSAKVELMSSSYTLGKSPLRVVEALCKVAFSDNSDVLISL